MGEENYRFEGAYICGGCKTILACEYSRWEIGGTLFLVFMCPKCRNDDGIGLRMSEEQVRKMLRVIPDRLKAVKT